MKLRLHHNSIRLRLSPADVQQLDRDGHLESTLRLPPSATFRFGLHAVASASAMTARLEHNTLMVLVPRQIVRHWADSDEVAIRGVEPLGEHGELRILIEKDFECVDVNPDEPPETLYPNPNKRC